MPATVTQPPARSKPVMVCVPHDRYTVDRGRPVVIYPAYSANGDVELTIDEAVDLYADLGDAIREAEALAAAVDLNDPRR